jgi:MOSC domain-containing protein YiiM
VTGRIVRLSVSPGGVPKTRVTAVRVGAGGLAGDGHRDAEHHGGPERAVCLYARVLAGGAIREGDPVQIVTDGGAARLAGPTRA